MKEIASDQPLQTASPIVELRQYTMHPEQRDILIDLFEREFIEPQEAVEISVIGQFRDVDNPNRFVWLRGFPDMHSRHCALAAFYGGPVWHAHRNAANATILDSDNVLLLRPVRPATGFLVDPRTRQPFGAQEVTPAVMVATILSWDAAPSTDFLDLFEHALYPLLTEKGASILSYFITEASPNTFRALPVREGEHVFVWFSRFQDRAAYDDHIAELAQTPEYRDLWEPMARQFNAPPQILKLAPTTRSLLRG